jgi:heparan-alpha-glucosaminide N-acetyltransferase
MADLKAGRLVSLDAYRGLIMLTLAGSAFGLHAYATKQLANPDHPAAGVLQFVKFHTDHPKEWVSNFKRVGVSYWDLIQPSFMFMVGVAMPFSYTKRLNRGDSYWTMAGHALVRSIILILLGVFLESTSAKGTLWQFPCVLSQIGLGYMVVFFLMGRPWPVQMLAGAAILGVYWYWFVHTPVPGAESMQDFAAHFSYNENAAAYLDQKWLTKFRSAMALDPAWISELDKGRYVNKGGYATLNFVPSIGTMLLGLMCGEMLMGDRRDRSKLLILFVGGAALMGLAIAVEPFCPIVKRIWSPSWTLFSGAYVLWILGTFYGIIDVAGWKRWAFPLVVLGVNSILLYLLGMLVKGWVGQQLKIHFGQDLFDGPYGDIVRASSVMAVFWLLCFWLYRQRLFVRI